MQYNVIGAKCCENVMGYFGYKLTMSFSLKLLKLFIETHTVIIKYTCYWLTDNVTFILSPLSKKVRSNKILDFFLFLVKRGGKIFNI